MSERSLKIIFALVVFVFVLLGKNYTPLNEKSVRVDVFVNNLENKTASLVATNELPQEPKVQVKESAAAINKTEIIPIATTSTKLVPIKNLKSGPSISASMFLIGDLEESVNIAQLSINNRWPIASLTKLMTAVVVLEQLPKNTSITIGPNISSIEGSSGFIVSPREFLVEDLIKAMMVSSNNHAAYAIQEYFGKEKFVKLMNDSASRLGMNDTYFDEATGLSVLNQSTADDLKILVKFIWQSQRQIFEYSKMPEVTITDLKTNKVAVIKNINIFAGDADFLGGKTGFITDSGGNLISIFKRADRKIITIILGAEDRFLETSKLVSWFDKDFNR